MSIFKNIDSKLEVLSQKLEAKLSKDRSDFFRKIPFEERRIDWTEDGIRKAIIIQPHFALEGVNSDFWYLVIASWKNERLTKRKQWKKNLIEKKDFSEIENNIENLLLEAASILKNIKEDDLIIPQFTSNKNPLINN